MRRSEVSALRWADVDVAAGGDGVLVTVRRGQDQPGERDVGRPVREGCLRPRDPDAQAAAGPVPEDRVAPLSPKMVGLRFKAAVRAGGSEHVTAHSGRAGLASGADEPGARRPT